VDLHSPSGVPSLDQQLQQYLRGAASRDRDVERIGPFLATFDPHSTIPYLSYAIPDDGARPTMADVAALVDAYARHDRLPRLEYLPTAAPGVEAALLAGGFVVDARLAVMTCAVGAAVDLEPGDGIVIAPPTTDEDFRAMRAAQYAAFGEIVEDHPSDGDDEELARQRQRLADGGLALLARDLATGAVVGGGVATVPGDGVTEIAGNGVLEQHRRRGIAGAITAALARAAHAAGTTTVWLTPGGDGAHRVYARAGFTDTTSQVHLSRPA
jgi:GNAT superfamily N-acetyltransferase